MKLNRGDQSIYSGIFFVPGYRHTPAGIEAPFGMFRQVGGVSYHFPLSTGPYEGPTASRDAAFFRVRPLSRSDALAVLSQFFSNPNVIWGPSNSVFDAGFIPAKFLAGAPRNSDFRLPFQGWGYPLNIDQAKTGIVCSGLSRDADEMPCRQSHGMSGGPLIVGGFVRGVTAKEGILGNRFKTVVTTNFGQFQYNLYRALP
jgi:hypothetical protein